MAKIRIVDEWLRSPVSTPTRSRAIMVVSSSWSEQRVLMRAYAGSADQTRPTIVLHGAELAIGPAGTDPHSEWGIHVKPPADGRAQQLREQLELAAKRLAGSKGNPPRLADEVPSFETRSTNLWAPGTPRATPSVEQRRAILFEPSGSTGAAAASSSPDARTVVEDSRAIPFSAPAASHQANKGGGFRSTPAPIHRSELAALHAAAPKTEAAGDRVGRATVIGFESGAEHDASRPRARSSSTPAPDPGQSLARLVGHTMPLGFSLSDEERRVLNALGGSDALTATEVGEIAGVGNGISWMEAFMGKLATHGLDLVQPGDDRGGEPTYILRS